MKKKNTIWTPSRKKSFIISALRGAFRKYPAKYECLKEASVGKKVNGATGRVAEHYKCAECKKDFPASGVQVDHILPCVDPEVGFVDWNTFIQRLFCSKENLQVLCKADHLEKSKKERMMKKK
jgi:hypothetical protein